MAASTSPRSRGRPRVPDETRKRNNVTIRMRDELKAKVEQSAAGQQRSISEEIESDWRHPSPTKPALAVLPCWGWQI